MKRYDCVTTGDSWGMGCSGSMEEENEGDWVKWEDYKRLRYEFQRLLDAIDPLIGRFSDGEPINPLGYAFDAAREFIDA